MAISRIVILFIVFFFGVAPMIFSEDCIQDYILTDLSGHKKNNTSVEFGLGIRIKSISDGSDIFRPNDIVVKVDDCEWQLNSERGKFYRFDTTVDYLGFVSNSKVKSIKLIRGGKIIEFKKNFFSGYTQKEIQNIEFTSKEDYKKNSKYNNKVFVAKDKSENIYLLVTEYTNTIFLREKKDNSFRIIPIIELANFDGLLIIKIKGRSIFKIVNSQFDLLINKDDYLKLKDAYPSHNGNELFFGYGF